MEFLVKNNNLCVTRPPDLSNSSGITEHLLKNDKAYSVTGNLSSLSDSYPRTHQGLSLFRPSDLQRACSFAGLLPTILTQGEHPWLELIVGLLFVLMATQNNDGDSDDQEAVVIEDNPFAATQVNMKAIAELTESAYEIEAEERAKTPNQPLPTRRGDDNIWSKLHQALVPIVNQKDHFLFYVIIDLKQNGCIKNLVELPPLIVKIDDPTAQWQICFSKQDGRYYWEIKKDETMRPYQVIRVRCWQPGDILVPLLYQKNIRRISIPSLTHWLMEPLGDKVLIPAALRSLDGYIIPQ